MRDHKGAVRRHETASKLWAHTAESGHTLPGWRILPTRLAASLKPSKSAVSGMRLTT